MSKGGGTHPSRRGPRLSGGDPGFQKRPRALGTFWGGGGPPSRGGAGGARLWEAGGHGDGMDPAGEGDGRPELYHHDVVVLGGGVVVGVWHQFLHHLPHLTPLPRVEVVLAQADGGDPTAGRREAWDTQRGGEDHKTMAHVWGLEATVRPRHLWGMAWLGHVGHRQPGPYMGHRDCDAAVAPVGRGMAGTRVGCGDCSTAMACVGHGPARERDMETTVRPWHVVGRSMSRPRVGRGERGPRMGYGGCDAATALVGHVRDMGSAAWPGHVWDAAWPTYGTGVHA